MPRKPQDDPEVIRVLRQHRAALIAREENQIDRMAKTWLQLESSLKDEMTLLALDIQNAMASGDVITEQLLRRMARYQKLDNQMQRQILNYVKDVAVPDIEKEQLEYGLMAINASSETIRISSALGYAFDRLPKDAVETYVGYLGDGTPLYRLLKQAYPDALDGVVKTFLDGAARGLSPITIANDASKSLGIGLDRITLIARTEQLRVNRAVSAEQYRTSGLNGVMRRVATKDHRVCMACLVSDGEIIALDKELEDHPRGRCVAIFQIAGANPIEWEKGPDWFLKQDEGFQRSMLGDEKFNMWKEGLFDLSELRQTDHNKIWGNSPRVATIEELRKGKAPVIKTSDKQARKAIEDLGDQPNEDTFTSLHEFESSIIKNKFETAAIYGQDGKLIFKKKGAKSSVSFTNEQLKLMKGAVVTHNHPQGSPFSYADLMVFSGYDLKEMRAAGQYYTYIMRNSNNVKLTKQKFGELYDQALYLSAKKHYKENLSDNDALHYALEELANLAGVEYERKPAK